MGCGRECHCRAIACRAYSHRDEDWSARPCDSDHVVVVAAEVGMRRRPPLPLGGGGLRRTPTFQLELAGFVVVEKYLT